MYQRRLLIAIALVSLMAAGFLAASLSSYFIAKRYIYSQISDQALPLTSDNIFSEIQRDIFRPVLISSMMANDTFLKDWALNGERDEMPVRDYLSEIQQKYDTITSYFVSDKLLNYYHPTGILRKVSPDDPQDNWFFRVRNMQEPYEINIDRDTYDENQINIFVNYRVLDDDGAYLGATGVGLSLGLMSALIDSYESRYNRTIYFVDRGGALTLTGTSLNQSPHSSLQERLGEDLSDQILSSEQTRLIEGAGADQLFINSRLVPEFDWYLIVEQAGGGATLQIKNVLWINIGLSIGILLVVIIAGHLTVRNYQNKLVQMATTDTLTGLANRHMFEMMFEQLRKSVARTPRNVSLLSVDVDFFKKVNDEYGHAGGDEVLQVIAGVLKSNIRESDIVARWGGEEFVMLLDNCSVEAGQALAQKLCDLIRKQNIPFRDDTLKVTISCGVAELKAGELLSDFFRRSDLALYTAKKSGRDRVCLAD